MLEFIAGTLLLLLGWQCFGHASRVRAVYTGRPAQHPWPFVEMPTVVNKTPGLLLVPGGMALPALAALERLRAAGRVDVF